MKASPMIRLYVTLAALLGIAALLLAVIALSRTGLQPVTGLPPFPPDDPHTSQPAATAATSPAP